MFYIHQKRILENNREQIERRMNMIRKQLYGKTSRFKRDETTIVTEKIDGANLTFFKLNETLYIAERRRIFTMDEIDQIEYRGLKEWLKEHGEALEESLFENAAIIGEWIGMGKLRYDFTSPFMQFAKGNIYEDFELVNLRYEEELFHYSFIESQVPDFIGRVPIVGRYETSLTLEELNELYDRYSEVMGRPVEGFIVNTLGHIRKYVRRKRGKLEDHVESYPRRNQEAQTRLLNYIARENKGRN